MRSLVSYNDDVLVEILLRLPTKSLIRLKSVCRRWRSLISGDEFCHLHTLRRHKPQPSLLLQRRQYRFFYYFNPFADAPKFVPHSFDTLPHDSTIVSSCNGLLLLQSENHSCYVCNPATKQSRMIRLTQNHDYPHVLGMNLAFDPLVSPHYKIVSVRAANTPPGYSEPTPCQIEVYDSVSREWKVCSELLAARDADFCNGVHWNNLIHWKRSSGLPYLCFDTNKSDVVRFMPQEKIPLRRGGRGTAYCSHLQESNDRLYHFDIIQSGSQHSVAVYELQQDYSEWSFKYPLWLDLGQIPGRLHLLSFVRGGDGETDTLVIHVPGQILAYRFLDKSLEQLVDMTKLPPNYIEDALNYPRRNVHQFGETLALV